MLSPNRLLTTQEQWLLIGILVAVLAGSVTLYLHSRSNELPEDTVIVDDASPAHRAPSPDPESVRRMEAEPLSPPSPTHSKNLSPAVSPPQSKNMPLNTGGIIEQALPEKLPVEPSPIGVAAMGAVEKPGLYMVPDTYRIADLIALAGGATEQADLSEILLTAPLIDETTLTVPDKPVHVRAGIQAGFHGTTSTLLRNPPPYLKRYAHTAGVAPVSEGQQSQYVQPETTHPAPPGISASGAGLINVNQATAAQLQELPGIGPALSAAIIAERERQPFARVEDLDRVPGIGEKRLSAIRSLITAP